jgi:hypothetical protein
MSENAHALPADWPLIDPHDDGIRPAGNENACCYCQQQIGQLHRFNCVIVKRKVELSVVARFPDGVTCEGIWTLDEPYSSDAHDIEFHKNESSWCSNNFLHVQEREPESVRWTKLYPGAIPDPCHHLKALADHRDGFGGCLCRDEILTFRFERVVDSTPRRELVRPLPLK